MSLSQDTYERVTTFAKLATERADALLDKKGSSRLSFTLDELVPLMEAVLAMIAYIQEKPTQGQDEAG